MLSAVAVPIGPDVSESVRYILDGDDTTNHIYIMYTYISKGEGLQVCNSFRLDLSYMQNADPLH